MPNTGNNPVIDYSEPALSLVPSSPKKRTVYDQSMLESNLAHCKTESPSPAKIASSAIGGAMGLPLAYFASSTGATTALHEIVGHGYLGSYLTNDYPAGKGPTFWIYGFDKYKAIGEADSAGDKIKAFFYWLFGSVGDQNGLAGRTTHRGGQPNSLGSEMGSAGNSAWISIAGSIPGLVLDTACVAGGMAIKDKYPALGWGLTVFGLINNLNEASYAISAVLMTSSELQFEGATGHDFANFANKMSEITGLQATNIAIGVAAFWLSFVPLVALGMFLYQETHQIDIVPDALALRHWLAQMAKDEDKQKLFLELLLNYSNKERLPFYTGQGRLIDFAQDKEEQKNLLEDFNAYLIKKLSKKHLKKAKKEILKQWQALQVQTSLEQALSYSKVALAVVSATWQIIHILATTVVPDLLPVAAVFGIVVPILGVLSIASSAYETYKDLKSPSSQVPDFAKILSCLKLLTTTLMTTALLIATFLPGAQIIILPTLIIGTLLTIILSFAKFKIIQAKFKETQGNKEEQSSKEDQAAPAEKGSAVASVPSESLRRHGFFHLASTPDMETISEETLRAAV